MKRILTPELLDSDSGTPAEVVASLGDLRRINLWFGGVSTTEEMIRRIARETKMSSLSLLEVAAGSGYVPKLLAMGWANRACIWMSRYWIARLRI